MAKTLITAQPDLAHKYASATSSRADADEGADINDVVGGSNNGVEGGKKQRGKATSGKTSSKADGSMGGAGSIKVSCQWLLDSEKHRNLAPHSLLVIDRAAPSPRRGPRPATPTTHPQSRCFQILGFDVMLDRKHKPWLIEINHGPSMVNM